MHRYCGACIGLVCRCLVGVVGASVLSCVHWYCGVCIGLVCWCLVDVVGASVLSWVHCCCRGCIGLVILALLSWSHWFCHGDKLLLWLSYLAVAISILTLFVLFYLNNSTVKPKDIKVCSQVLLRLDFVFVFRWTACGSSYKKRTIWTIHTQLADLLATALDRVLSVVADAVCCLRSGLAVFSFLQLFKVEGTLFRFWQVPHF